jgi:hypothetical protein
MVFNPLNDACLFDHCRSTLTLFGLRSGWTIGIVVVVSTGGTARQESRSQARRQLGRQDAPIQLTP